MQYHAYMIIGSKFPAQRLYADKRKPACRHSFDNEFVFCPHCGTRTTVSRSTPLDGFSPSGMTISGEFPVIYEKREDIAYIAYYFLETTFGLGRNHKQCDFFDNEGINSAYRRTKERLSEMGIWTEESFGIWMAIIEVNDEEGYHGS